LFDEQEGEVQERKFGLLSRASVVIKFYPFMAVD